MAKGKYHAWLKPDKLREITNWAAKGLTDKQIAKNIGINVSTLYSWLDKYREFSDALTRGREMRDVEVENALFMAAVGAVVVEETITEFDGQIVDGKPYNGKTKQRKTTKKLPPDVNALRFLMKNRMGWSENPNASQNEIAQAPVFVFDASVYAEH